MYTIKNLKAGETAVIDKINLSPPLLYRLYDIGLCEGAKVTLLHRAPFLDPLTFSVFNTAVALREKDAEKITVRKV